MIQSRQGYQVIYVGQELDSLGWSGSLSCKNMDTNVFLHSAIEPNVQTEDIIILG